MNNDDKKETLTVLKTKLQEIKDLKLYFDAEQALYFGDTLGFQSMMVSLMNDTNQNVR